MCVMIHLCIPYVFLRCVFLRWSVNYDKMRYEMWSNVYYIYIVLYYGVFWGRRCADNMIRTVWLFVVHNMIMTGIWRVGVNMRCKQCDCVIMSSINVMILLNMQWCERKSMWGVCNGNEYACKKWLICTGMSRLVHLVNNGMWTVIYA